QRRARALRMFEQRAQDRRRRDAAERADERPIVRAGAALPAAVAGRHARRVIEEVLCPGEHDVSLFLCTVVIAIVIARSVSSEAIQNAPAQTILDCFAYARND